MKVQFVRLFLKPPVVVLAHLAQLSSILTLRSVAFCPVVFCLSGLLSCGLLSVAFCPVAFCLYQVIGLSRLVK